MDAGAPIRLDDFDFAALLAPLSVKEYDSTIRSKRPVHVAGGADKFAFAMSWPLLNELLARSAIWTPRTLAVVQDTTVVPGEHYCRPGLGRDGMPGLVADFEKVRAFVKQGASLVLNAVERMTPGMARISEVLGETHDAAIGANLYCSWQKHQAFSVHFDTHDVFAFQIAGTKAWRIYQRHFKDPIKHPRFTTALDKAYHAANKGPLTMEFVMKPGDFVYIPSGFYHEALATSEASIHVSYSVTPLIGVVALAFLFEKGLEDASLRAPLPHPDRDPQGFAAALGGFGAKLREMLRDPKIRAELEEKIRANRFERQRIQLPGGED